MKAENLISLFIFSAQQKKLTGFAIPVLLECIYNVRLIYLITDIISIITKGAILAWTDNEQSGKAFANSPSISSCNLDLFPIH